MKQFKLPVISKEEQQEMWNNLKAGDKIIEFNRNYWYDSYHIYIYEVVRRTPKGSVRLSNGTLLKLMPYNHYVESKEVIECVGMLRLERNIFDLLNKIDRDKKEFKKNLELEDAVKLKELLEKILNPNE